MDNSLDLDNSWVRETVEELQYPVERGQLLTIFKEEIDPELPEGISLDPDRDDLNQETYESVAEAWDALEKNFLISTDLIDIPDHPATND
jgi:hypothetical protein